MNLNRPSQLTERPFLLIGAIVAIVVIGGLFWWAQDTPKDFPELENEISEDQSPDSIPGIDFIPDDWVARPSDGVFVSPEDKPEKHFAVMIENSADAWPLSALADARIVFEAPVEGNIPRYMAIFDDTQHEEIDRIGSVRSARPYFLDWAKGLGDIMYTHVGGSPEALQSIRSTGQPSLNEFFWGKYFYRENTRYAPHNVFTTINRLSEAYDERGYNDLDFSTGWKYKRFTEADKNEISQTVSIDFSPSSIYTAKWEYDSSNGSYIRYQGGEKQNDHDGQEVRAKNIVAMIGDIAVIDEIGRKSIRTIGEGEARLVQAGSYSEITWKKEGKNSPLKFYKEDGEEVAFIRGPIWIEVIPSIVGISVE